VLQRTYMSLLYQTDETIQVHCNVPTFQPLFLLRLWTVFFVCAQPALDVLLLLYFVKKNDNARCSDGKGSRFHTESSPNVGVSPVSLITLHLVHFLPT
jgi:hypothetical protein